MPAFSPRVLVVDDEPGLTQPLGEALESLGAAPFVAFNGQQALDELARECPDLVVLDAHMPVMDGFQVLEAIRANPATRSLPVILLTEADNNEEIVRGMRLGATMTQSKPIEITKLKSLITAVLGSRR